MGFRWISLLATAGIFAALVPMALARPEGDEADRKEARAIGLAPPESPLERAREESGAGEPSRGRFDLPAGDLRVSPTQVLAARPGQRIRFTVTLDPRVPGAHAARDAPPPLDPDAARDGCRRSAGRCCGRAPAGGARLRRTGRDLALAFDDVADGATASFDVVATASRPAPGACPSAGSTPTWTDHQGRARRSRLPRPEPRGRDDDPGQPRPGGQLHATTDSRNPRPSSQPRRATRTASRWGSTGPTRAWRRGSAMTRARRGRRAPSPRRSTPRATHPGKREHLLRPDDGGRRPRQRLVRRPDVRP